jgi:hypothetical protein
MLILEEAIAPTKLSLDQCKSGWGSWQSGQAMMLPDGSGSSGMPAKVVDDAAT